jgi:hypothetical protein
MAWSFVLFLYAKDKERETIGKLLFPKRGEAKGTGRKLRPVE